MAIIDFSAMLALHSNFAHHRKQKKIRDARRRDWLCKNCKRKLSLPKSESGLCPLCELNGVTVDEPEVTNLAPTEEPSVTPSWFDPNDIE